MRAIATDLEPADHDVKTAVALNLPLEPVEEVAFKFSDLATAQARHVNMIALRPALVEMFLALHVHEVEFVNQAVALQEFQSAINRDPVNARIQTVGLAQDLASIQMLLGSFDHAQNGTALVGKANAA